MAKIFRVWEKKRGDRRTGSRFIGELGEGIFFGLLFLLGTVSLTFLVTVQVARAEPEVLVPGYGFWLVVIVLGSFILLGGGGLLYSVLQIGASAERRSALAKRAANIELLSEATGGRRAYPSIPGDTNLTNSPGIHLAFRLPVSHTTAWQLLAATLFCIVWNGITAVLITVTIRSPQWFLFAVMIPFLAISTWSVYFFVQQILISTGIGPTNLEINRHPLIPGETYDIHLTQSGHLHFDSLQLKIQCVEECSFQQGTDIRADVEVVYEDSLLVAEDFEVDPSQPFETECQLSIPDIAMHSFQATHNAVHWNLVVEGTAKRWPTFERTFPLIVFPENFVDETAETASEDGTTD